MLEIFIISQIFSNRRSMLVRLGAMQAPHSLRPSRLQKLNADLTISSSSPITITMRIASLFSAFCAVTMVAAAERSTQLFIQPIEAAQKPSFFAEIVYDLESLSSSSITEYEVPELPESAKTVRIGVYDKKSSQWVSGTTVASVDNFNKGYKANFLLSVDTEGEVVSASMKGIKVDAGYTRDFGPKVVVLPEVKGKQPQLNKPVVLSAEGKREEAQEKSFIQKYVPALSISRYIDSLLTCICRYWWAFAIGAFVILAPGGDDK